MPCLIAFVKAESFAEGLTFVDYIEGLPGNSLKRKKKHFIIMTQTVDHSLLQNRTGNFNVHIISQDGVGL